MPPNAPQRDPASPGAPRRPRRALSRLIPLLMLLGVAALVLYREVPQVRDTVLAYLEPQAVHALEICRTAALRQSTSPGFARLIDHGQTHATPGGYYVDRVVVGDMLEGRGEVRFAVTCHVDSAGNLAQIHREAHTSSAPSEASEPRSGAPGK
ncbi:MAG: hypothetical protein ACFCUJ_08590 [Thiotrichales bacterium]